MEKMKAGRTCMSIVQGKDTPDDRDRSTRWDIRNHIQVMLFLSIWEEHKVLQNRGDICSKVIRDQIIQCHRNHNPCQHWEQSSPNSCNKRRNMEQKTCKVSVSSNISTFYTVFHQ